MFSCSSSWIKMRWPLFYPYKGEAVGVGVLGRGANLEEHDFSECALGIGVVLERIEDLLQGDCLLGLLIYRLPYYTVGLPEL